MDDICECRRCLRLVDWREQVAREKKKAHLHEIYWGKPVPNFGDPNATHLIVGLAPAAHGANRTGRMFTGDRSGDWLYRALHRAGVANQPTAHSRNDGLTLTGILITAVCHCAPPDNKPLPEEIANCSSYLHDVIHSRPWTAILCLGSLAWLRVAVELGEPRRAFGHASAYRSSGGIHVVGSYHPSQQNTFTGRLTEAMLDQAIELWWSSAPQIV